jgi:hypothetical protein
MRRCPRLAPGCRFHGATDRNGLYSTPSAIANGREPEGRTSATCRHTIGQKFASPTAGSKVQPTSPSPVRGDEISFAGIQPGARPSEPRTFVGRLQLRGSCSAADPIRTVTLSNFKCPNWYGKVEPSALAQSRQERIEEFPKSCTSTKPPSSKARPCAQDAQFRGVGCFQPARREARCVSICASRSRTNGETWSSAAAMRVDQFGAGPCTRVAAFDVNERTSSFRAGAKRRTPRAPQGASTHR